MSEKYLSLLRNMSPLEMLENGAIIVILLLGLVMFFRSSSPFNRYFIPTVCILAALLRIAYWAQNGDEPPFMTPLVSLVSNWIS